MSKKCKCLAYFLQYRNYSKTCFDFYVSLGHKLEFTDSHLNHIYLILIDLYQIFCSKHERISFCISQNIWTLKIQTSKYGTVGWQEDKIKSLQSSVCSHVITSFEWKKLYKRYAFKSHSLVLFLRRIK